MKNKAIWGLILLFAIVITASSALATKSVNIAVDSVNITGYSGAVSRTFNVQNTGDEAFNVSLITVSPIISAIGKTVEITGLTIASSILTPGATTTGTITVNLNTAVAGTYQGIIKADADNGAAFDFLFVNVVVTDNGQSFFFVSPILINTTQSDSTVYQTLTLQNNANKDISIQIAKEGYGGMTFTVDKLGPQTIAAFGTLNIASSVQVPADKAAGSYTATVNATDSTTTRTANLRADVMQTFKASVPAVTISDADPGETKAVSFSIANKGNMPLTGLSLSNFSISDNDGDRINVTFSPDQGINASVGASATVNANAAVSDKMDSGSYSQQVTLSGSSISQIFTLSVNVNSLLKVTEVEFNPDEVLPGEEFDVDVTVENIGDDIDLEDVELEIFIMDGNNVLQDDDDDDVKDDMEVGDLDNGDEQKVTFTFKMPYNTEDGDSFGVKVVAKGENADDSSEKFEDIYTEDSLIDVERDEHKVDIYQATLDSSILSCVKTTYVDVGLRDVGANDEDVIITIRNDQIGLRVQDNFDMSSDYEDEEFEVEKSYQLDFNSAPAGTYPVTIVAENDDGDKLGDKTISIRVEECGATPVTTPTTGGTSTTGTTTTTTPSGTTGTTTGTTGTTQVVYTSPSEITGTTIPAVSATPVISKAKKGSVFDSTLGMATLVLGNLLLLVLIVIAVIYLFSGSARRKDVF